MALLFDYWFLFSSVQRDSTVASHCCLFSYRSVRPTTVFSVKECSFLQLPGYFRIWATFSGSGFPWPWAPLSRPSMRWLCSEVLRLGVVAQSSVIPGFASHGSAPHLEANSANSGSSSVDVSGTHPSCSDAVVKYSYKITYLYIKGRVFIVNIAE